MSVTGKMIDEMEFPGSWNRGRLEAFKEAVEAVKASVDIATASLRLHQLADAAAAKVASDEKENENWPL